MLVFLRPSLTIRHSSSIGGSILYRAVTTRAATATATDDSMISATNDKTAASDNSVGVFSSSSLPNSIECRILTSAIEEKDGKGEGSALEFPRLYVTVRTRPISRDAASVSIDNIKQQPADGSDPDAVPDSVLQYQRQLRKMQANTRSLTPLNAKDHLRILFEDDHLLVADKPSGVLCVPGLYNKPNLLQLVHQHVHANNTNEENAVKHIDDPAKMIVHRLDMDTSGVVVFAKTTKCQKALQAKFRDKNEDETLIKEYHTLVCGYIEVMNRDPNKEGAFVERGDIHLPLKRDHRHPPFMRVATPRSEEEAKRAVKDLQTHGFKKLVNKAPKASHTEFRVLAQEGSIAGRPATRLLLIPHTGRTHQLRVHMAAMGHPILGDPAYGLYGESSPLGGCTIDTTKTSRGDSNNRNIGSDHDDDDDDDSVVQLRGASLDLQRQFHEVWPSPEKSMCLHAARLRLRHPMTQEVMDWRAPTPF